MNLKFVGTFIRIALLPPLVSLGMLNIAAASQETGQYCEVKPSACAVDRTASEPNELPTPEQIDWDNHPMYEHGGQPPKNAK